MLWRKGTTVEIIRDLMIGSKSSAWPAIFSNQPNDGGYRKSRSRRRAESRRIMQGMFASGFVTTLWPDWELSTSTLGAAPTETGLVVNDGRGIGDAGILIECLQEPCRLVLNDVLLNLNGYNE